MDKKRILRVFQKNPTPKLAPPGAFYSFFSSESRNFSCTEDAHVTLKVKNVDIA